MLEISSKTNLLEKNSYRYSLQDVSEPNLQRDIYSYGTVPKVAFNHRRVPLNMPEEIWITDTSLRDGQQSVEPYTVDQVVNIYKLLSKLGGPYGIIRQTEFFIYSQKDRKALEKCMELGLKFPEITSWIRASKEDFKLVKDLGIKETGILVSCSDYHIFKKMKMTRSQVLDYYLGTVKDAFNAGVIPRCHLEDITRADFYGFVVPFVNELQALSREAGIPVKIRACDTMGYGVPYTEASLPRSVAGIVYGLQHYSDVPSECLEWHGHNDFYKAVANASTAWLYGACAVNCSLLGITVDDLVDIMDIRIRCEGLAARYAARNRTEEEAKQLRHLIELQDFYVDKGDVDHLRELDDEFHDGIYAFSRRHVLMDTLRPLHRKTQRYRRASVAQRRQVSTDEHKAICEAICAGNEDEAERLMCEHIQNAKKSMIERFSQNGEYNR